MKNMQTPSPGGSSEYHERSARKIDAKYYVPHNDGVQTTIEHLMEAGFVWEEAVTLLNMREHLYENVEMRQRMESNQRMHFARWLRENGEMNED